MKKSTSSGVEIIQIKDIQHYHTTAPRVRVWVTGNLQPKQYNQIEIGVSIEEDVPKGKLPSAVLNKSFNAIFKDLNAQIRKAFAKMNFKF